MIVKDFRLDFMLSSIPSGDMENPSGTSRDVIFGRHETSWTHSSSNGSNNSSDHVSSPMGCKGACIARIRRFDSGMCDGIESLLLDRIAKLVRKDDGSTRLKSTASSRTIFSSLVQKTVAMFTTEI